jgi:hypothetical protein
MAANRLAPAGFVMADSMSVTTVIRTHANTYVQLQCAQHVYTTYVLCMSVSVVVLQSAGCAGVCATERTFGLRVAACAAYIYIPTAAFVALL